MRHTSDTSALQDIDCKGQKNPVLGTAKIADALEVSLDYLVGKTSVEVEAKTLKRLQDIQKLTEQDKTTVLELVDAFLRDRKTKKHYAE